MRDFIQFLFSRDAIPYNLFAWAYLVIGFIVPILCLVIYR